MDVFTFVEAQHCLREKGLTVFDSILQEVFLFGFPSKTKESGKLFLLAPNKV